MSGMGMRVAIDQVHWLFGSHSSMYKDVETDLGRSRRPETVFEGVLLSRPELPDPWLRCCTTQT